MPSEYRDEWSDQYGIPCISVEDPDRMNAESLIAACLEAGAVRFVDGIEFCVELRNDVGPELWTEESLRRSVGRLLERQMTPEAPQ